MISYQCGKCGANMESPSSLAGREEICPACGAVNNVPDAPLAPFRPVTTRSPLQALAGLSAAMKHIPPLSDDVVRSEYVAVEKIWGSRELHVGADADIQGLVLRNLEALAESTNLENFRVELIRHCAQINAVFPKAFVPIRVWRRAQGYAVCGNYAFGDPPGKVRSSEGAPPERLDAQGRIEIRVSRDGFGEAIKQALEYLQDHYPEGEFARRDLPSPNSDFLQTVERIQSGRKRPGDPMLVMTEDVSSPRDVARNMILHEMRRALLVEASLRGRFSLTPKGRKSVMLFV